MGHMLGQTVAQPAGPASAHVSNRRLRLERLVRGWEQDDVAAALEELCVLLGEPAPRVDANLVSKWERGIRTPGRHYTARLCLVFQLPPELLGLRSGPRLAADCRRLSQSLGQALGRRLGHVNRRDFIHHLLWGGAAVATGAVDGERIVAAASGRVDGRLLDDLQRIAAEDAGRMHTVAPADLLPQVERRLAQVRALLRTPRPESEQVRLHLVAGTMVAVAGMLSFRLGNPGDAHVLWMEAHGHSRESGDGWLAAYVLSLRSALHSELWGGRAAMDRSAAVGLLDAAHAAAGSGCSPWVLAWVSARRAEEHALAGRARAADQDLEQAAHSLSTAAADDTNLFADWQAAPSARLALIRGNCAQLLGRARDATAAIEDGLAGLSPSLAAVRCSALTDLAMAYAKDAEVERACELVTESLEVSAEARLSIYVQRAVRVRRHLARWDATPAVRQLDEQLRGITWAPV